RPVDGAELDVPSAAAEIKRSWTTGRTVALPVRTVRPPGQVSDEAIARAIAEVATPAVAAPVRVLGEGAQATLGPAAIAAPLRFAPDQAGGLRPELDVPKLADVAKPQLARTEKPAKDATVTLAGNRPVTVPSVDGRGVDYPATFASLVDAF